MVMQRPEWAPAEFDRAHDPGEPDLDNRRYARAALAAPATRGTPEAGMADAPGNPIVAVMTARAWNEPA